MTRIAAKRIIEKSKSSLRLPREKIDNTKSVLHVSKVDFVRVSLIKQHSSCCTVLQSAEATQPVLVEREIRNKRNTIYNLALSTGEEYLKGKERSFSDDLNLASEKLAKNMEILGVKFAPLNIPLERRLQTLAVAIWVFITPFGDFLGFIATGYLLLYTQTIRYFVLLYFLWMYYDWDTCDRGGRR